MSYSHPETRQDEWVLDRVPGPGTFVELGAYNGLTHSNTLLLEENGWLGTLIEGHEEYADSCRKNRPEAFVRNEMIGSGKPGVFMVGGEWSGLIRTMPRDMINEHYKRNNPAYSTMTVPLVDVVGRGPWGYLSLDTEGGEYQILRDWFQAGGRAHGITVEYRYDETERIRFEVLCEKYGMRLDDIRGFDLCFLRRP